MRQFFFDYVRNLQCYNTIFFSSLSTISVTEAWQEWEEKWPHSQLMPARWFPDLISMRCINMDSHHVCKFEPSDTLLYFTWSKNHALWAVDQALRFNGDPKIWSALPRSTLEPTVGVDGPETDSVKASGAHARGVYLCWETCGQDSTRNRQEVPQLGIPNAVHFRFSFISN